MDESTGAAINEAVHQAGCFTLVNLAGDYIYFYPRGRLPRYLNTYLQISDARRSRLRDFLMILGRDPTYP